MATGFTATDLLTEYGAYYVNEGQNASNLASTLYWTDALAGLFQRTTTQNDTWKGATVEGSELMQQFKTAYNPKGQFTLKPSPIKTWRVKLDYDLVPDEIEESYAGFLAADESLNRKDWPLIRWVVEVYLVNRWQQDKSWAAMNAVFVDNDDSLAASMDGFLKYIADELTATNLPAAFSTGITGTTTDVEFVGIVDEFVNSLPVHVNAQNLVLGLSEKLLRKYKRGSREKYNSQYLQVNEMGLATPIDFPNLSMRGLVGLGDSQRMFITMPGNLKEVVKLPNREDRLNFEEAKRVVNIMADHRIGYGAHVKQHLYVNDQV